MGFRDKELRALWPLLSLFWAIGIGSIAQRVLFRMSAKGASGFRG
jgi:hypothetical protein